MTAFVSLSSFQPVARYTDKLDLNDIVSAKADERGVQVRTAFGGYFDVLEEESTALADNTPQEPSSHALKRLRELRKQFRDCRISVLRIPQLVFEHLYPVGAIPRRSSVLDSCFVSKRHMRAVCVTSAGKTVERVSILTIDNNLHVVEGDSPLLHNFAAAAICAIRRQYGRSRPIWSLSGFHDYDKHRKETGYFCPADIASIQDNVTTLRLAFTCNPEQPPRQGSPSTFIHISAGVCVLDMAAHANPAGRPTAGLVRIGDVQERIASLRPA